MIFFRRVVRLSLARKRGKSMGFFDFLKFSWKKEWPTQNHIEKFSIPTIKPEKELFECYDEIFNATIRDVRGISREDASDILSLIKEGAGGYLNRGRYHETVWKKYFNGKVWSWNEYERWHETFRKNGKFPSRFPVKDEFPSPDISDDIDYALNVLRVAGIKDLCDQYEIKIPSKAKKKDLIEAAKTIPDIHKSPVLKAIIDDLNDRLSPARAIYALLMGTIDHRAKNLYDFRRAKKLGINKFEIVHTFEEDKEFVEMALKQNPNAIHPVYPSDSSYKKPIIFG